MKRVLIIGATSAIAIACARLWAAQNCAFFLVARNADKLAQTAHDLQARGAAAVHCFCMDANDHARHAPMLEQCLAQLHQLDIVLIAHGSLPDQRACEQDPALATEALMTNAISVIALAGHIANQLERQRHGSLAVITSVAGDRGRPSNYLYGSAKAAVSACCEGLRARLFRSQVQVIDIRPGFVDTPMTHGLPLPALLVASPEQVATRILRGIERGRDVLYTPGFWALIMLIVRNIPRPLFKRLGL